MFWLVAAVVIVLVTYSLLDRAIRSLKVGSLSNKYVFITGCDSGFGHNLALHLDKIGLRVFAGCFSEEGQSTLSQKASSRLICLPLDVASSESIENALEFVQQKLPQDTGLWAVVNNAGITGPVGPVEVCTQEDFHKTLAVNMMGPIQVCRQFLPLIRKARGRVVNMTSAMGRIVGEAPPYAVSKFGMEAFSDCLRRDLYTRGVKVSIIEPGFFRTHVVDKVNTDTALVKAFEAVSDDVRQAYDSELYIKSRTKLFRGTRYLASRDLSPVVQAYTHAVTSRFPRTRYVVGLDAKLVFIPLGSIPAGVADWLMYMWMTHGNKELV